MAWKIPGLVCIAAAGAVAHGALRLMMNFRGRLPLDVPNERSLHGQAVPRVGGIAMWSGGLAAAGCASLSAGSGGMLTVVVLAAAALALMSFLDDRRGLSAASRLLGHLGAAGVVAWSLPLAWPVLAGVVLALVWMTNLYNFMDGADGLAGGMAVFGFSAYGVAAVTGMQPALATACFTIVVAAAAFLILNFHPAKVFMGDAGSIPLGFLAGALGLMGWHEAIWPLWFPLLVFSPFIVDATLTLLRRALRGERVWRAHREHYYQRLVRLGWGHRRTAFAEYGLMSATTLSALVLLHLAAPFHWGGLLLWAAIYAGLAWRVDRAWAAAETP